MMIIRVDYHPSFQTIAFFVDRDLQKRGIRVRVGMEATGYSRWFERLLAELGFEVWMGDPAEIKANL
jgi:transposase